MKERSQRWHPGFCINPVKHLFCLYKFSTYPSTYYLHGIIYDVNFDYLAKLVSAKFLHYKTTFVPSFLYSTLWKHISKCNLLKEWRIKLLSHWEGGKDFFPMGVWSLSFMYVFIQSFIYICMDSEICISFIDMYTLHIKYILCFII